MEKTPETEEKNNQQEQQTGSPSPGKGPGRWEAIKQKILQKAGPWIERAKRHPETAVLGQFLYNVGFWGEYTARRMVRFAWNCIRKAGERIAWIWGRVAGLVKGALKTGAQDLTAPFARMANGAKNIRARVQEEKQVGTAHAAKEGLRYFASGVHKYFPLLGRAAAYVLPVAALAVFGYTVHTVLEYNYVLAVEVNGSVVGYVQTEQVFDSAKEEVAQRINYAGTDREGWTVEPSYQIAVGEDVMDENQMAAAILESSSDEIQNATGVYVNDELVAVTTEGDVLQADLDSMTAPYEDPDNPNLTVEFTKDIRLENSLYFTDTIVPVEDIIEKFHGEEQGAVYYTVQQGDTPWTVAGSFGISVDELQAQNPQQDFSSSFYVGDVLTISQAMPYLQVKRTLISTYQETIPYSTEEQEDNELAFGSTKIIQDGAEGLAEVTQQQVFYGDSSTPSETTIIDRVVVQEPVTKIIAKGKKLANGDLASTGSGSLMWPVPGYSYVSRWMSSYHKGADICAPYGTPIYAADSGVVTTAGYHYSYGNYVIINHGNGYQTLYAHASRLNVHVGQAVSQGDVIAYVGSTGNSTGNHCHFEVYVNGVRRSAREWFPYK
ncbi:peptidoglycan DD-metalloendopeptidase family protein [Allofournierella sp. CML151]|uniref:peptidoglycan DD-metalloendopeptidase family protein n=1 Tax=Allofournierella sp. CML151 TaxID=2998082 RepID=UPI0022EB6C33|nr:M23 family metallopeptidase [Fournierella sp. CML151]